MAKKAFEKFISTEIRGAKKKEMIRQEKKKVRAETKAFFEEKKQRERMERYGQGGANEKASGYTKKDNAPHKSEERRTPIKRGFSKKVERAPFPSTDKRSAEGKTGQRKTYQPRSVHVSKRNEPARTETKKPEKQEISKPAKPAVKKPVDTKPVKPSSSLAEMMPLNKYIAHAGICSRRDAAEIVRSGTVTVNDRHITEPGFKVSDKDDIRVNGKKITAKRPQVYILLNKPKDYLTTTEDPQGRKTVLDIIKNATSERVYPIGRLDRNTTGVLLLTNDGELAQKLAHPRYMVKKIYEVTLDKPLTKKDFDTVINGVTLEDGFIAPDSLAYADAKDKSVIGIEIHSGKNRIVRRIFESLGYDVRNLDRVLYANLTKKNVERGKWRMLTDKEVRLLKFMNSSYTRKQ